MEEDTFDKLKNKAKDVAEKVTDTDTYLGDKEGKEKNNEDYTTEGQRGSKEPMNPKEINKHEPTAVKRDKNQDSSGEPV
jgi:hypothetical protein